MKSGAMPMVFWLIVTSVVIHGLVAGLSFDVATVKLPTRRRIGVIAYANFARGNDLGNGLIVYPTLGVLALLIVFATTIIAYFTTVSYEIMTPLLLAVAGTIAHTLCTAKAAPIMLSLRHTEDDEILLTRKLNQFAFWHNLRALFQFLTFVILVWALIAAC